LRRGRHDLGSSRLYGERAIQAVRTAFRPHA